jgi:flagellar biosynthesis GTPase FlhF
MPFSDSLRAAVQAEIASRVLTAPSPPAAGAAVAFVGAGGAGKTSCAAALASVYGRESSLGVTVVAVDQPDGARDLRRMLNGDGVPVLSLSRQRAPRVIDAARRDGFVIVDTTTATPTDAAALAATAHQLRDLRLDAILIALPATLSPQAAARALDGLQQLEPTAIAITHADETDQLAVVVELAVQRRIPLAYLHSGRNHRNALHAVQASSVAERLLA